MSLTFTLSSAPSQADIEALEQSLSNYFAAHRTDAKDQPLLLLARDGEKVVAGIYAKTGWDQMYIRTLFVAEHLRGQGVGRKLIEDAEAEGRKRGCAVSWLMCSTEAAKRFYERRGYECFGEVERRAATSRYFMKKQLQKSGSEITL